MAHHHVIYRCPPNLALSRMRNYIVMAVEYPLDEPGSPELMCRLKIPKSLVPFILIVSPPFYTGLLFSSSIFLFAFYNITSGGLPWSVALAMDQTKQPWVAWSLLPWVVLIAGAIAPGRKAAESKLDLRLFRSQDSALEARTRGLEKESAVARTS
jgi:hypothetical protein